MIRPSLRNTFRFLFPFHPIISGMIPFHPKVGLQNCFDKMILTFVLLLCWRPSSTILNSSSQWPSSYLQNMFRTKNFDKRTYFCIRASNCFSMSSSIFGDTFSLKDQSLPSCSTHLAHSSRLLPSLVSRSTLGWATSSRRASILFRNIAYITGVLP